MIKKSSNDWYEDIVRTGIQLEIASPDGWDTTNLSKSFLEKITLDEFKSRLSSSCIYCPQYIQLNNYFESNLDN